MGKLPSMEIIQIQFMKKFILISFVFLLHLNGNTAENTPRRETRATWLATVWGLDWPYGNYSTGQPSQISTQKAILTNLLDNLQATSINTVLFQVRSRADAMYESSFEPWSQDVSGTRGTSPGYDPLKFAIEEAHKRGMELHAWINPYRFESAAGSFAGKPGDYSSSNPDWVLTVNNATILDPGNPEVQTRIKDIIAEIVTKYDIDGVVFDDYFYIGGITTQDSKSASLYKPNNMSLADWRRENVNTLIADVNTLIKSIKPHLLFGVSPRGTWTNDKAVAEKYGVTLPVTNRNGSDAYNEIYCDALAWIKANTVDYISPQIYWATNSNWSYTVLAKWWSEVANKFESQMYASQYLSEIIVPRNSAKKKTIKINNQDVPTSGLSNLEYMMLLSSKNKKNTKESTIPSSDFITQINNNRDFDMNGAPGSIFYSSKFLNYPTIRSLFLNNVFQNKSLRPSMWRPFTEETYPTNLRIEGNELKWDYTSDNVRYTVYAIPNDIVNNTGNFTALTHLEAVTYTRSYTISALKPTSSYTYAVAVLDRFGNEFTPIILGKNITTENQVTLLAPANGTNSVAPFNFTWQAIDGAEYYVFELAEDASFQNIKYKREIFENKLSTTNMSFLKTHIDYFWRVRAIKANTHIATSATSKFQAEIFSITAPNNDATVSATPTVKWTKSTDADSYLVEIASLNSFTESSIVHSSEKLANPTTEYTVPDKKLIYGQIYYIRVKAISDSSETISNVVKVTIEDQIPPIPIILSPENNSTINTNNLKITWQESPFASGFRVELSESEDFPLPVLIKTTNAYIYETTYENLNAGTYYFKIRATYGYSGRTNWSSVHKVNIAGNSIENEQNPKDVHNIVFENGNYYLDLNTIEATNISASIINLSGTKLFDIISNQTISGNHRFILPGGLNKGVYIILIENGGNTQPIKWIN